MKPQLSVIIPAYNEEKRLPPTLEQVGGYLSAKSWSHEIIVVSDGSADQTAEVAGCFQEKNFNLLVLEYEPNRGKGYAVKQGMLKATGRWRLFMDADSSTPIEELEKLLPHLKTFADNDESGYDIVIGSLAVAGAQINKREFFLRVAAGKIGNLLIQWLLLPGIQDTQRGFKLFTAEAAEKIFPQLTVDGWGFDIEALALARRFNFSIKEVPVYWSHNSASKISSWDYLQVLFDLLKLRWPI